MCDNPKKRQHWNDITLSLLEKMDEETNSATMSSEIIYISSDEDVENQEENL